MYHYLQAQDAMRSWRGVTPPLWLQPPRRPMDRLPLELKERIVEHVVWAHAAPEPGKEVWSDGSMRIMLGHASPLKHQVLARFERITGRGLHPTPAEKDLRSLMLASRLFLSICRRLLAETWTCLPTAFWSLPCLGLTSGEPCAGCDAAFAIPALAVEPGRGPHPRVTRVSLWRVSAAAASVFAAGVRLECPIDLLLHFGGFVNLAALALVNETFTWVADILEALPSYGRGLQQLSLVCIPSILAAAATLDRAAQRLQAIPHLKVIDFRHLWWEDASNVPRDWGISDWALGALPPSLEYANLAGLRGDITPERCGRLRQIWSASRLTRISLDRITLDDETLVRSFIESHAESLEFLSVRRAVVRLEIEDGLASDLAEKDFVCFPHLYHLLLDLDLDRDTDSDLGLSGVVPYHWRMPALRHLISRELQLSDTYSFDDIQALLTTFPLLKYLRLTCYSSDDEDEEVLADEQGLAVELAKSLVEAGVDAEIEVL